MRILSDFGQSGEGVQVGSRAERSRNTGKDGEFMKQHCRTPREVASSFEKTPPFDYVAAINNATMFWPKCSGLYGIEFPPLLPRQGAPSDMNFGTLPANHTFARTPKVDPMSRALAASEAQIADAQEFRTCGETGVSATPLVGSSYEVWELQER